MAYHLSGDGPEMLGKRCSVCLAGNLACTYDKPAKVRYKQLQTISILTQGAQQRYPAKGYVEDLEKRLAKLECLLKHVRPLFLECAYPYPHEAHS